MNVKRLDIVLAPDPARVILRPLVLVGHERQLRILARVLALGEPEVIQVLAAVQRDFGSRHRSLSDFLERRFEAVRHLLPTDNPLSHERQLLIGAYFTQEYSLEGAALFNPSIVVHPDQSDVSQGGIRFVLSLRATGEGHISSITFRTGIIEPGGGIRMESPTPFVTAARKVRHSIDKGLFVHKLRDLGIVHDEADAIVSALPDSFSMDQLSQEIENLIRHPRQRTTSYDRVLSRVLALAQANYEVTYTPEEPLSERVLFPTSPLESHGMEDARFVRFVDDDGETSYFATYTAYDGRDVSPQLIATKEFLTFSVSTLNGPEVRNKGMAMFPRKIRGQYAMLSRQDAENLYIMYSENVHYWHSCHPLLKPTRAWEFVQIGNCGSPVETTEGWLVISHGVGAMRKYSLGAFLLDLDDPSRVIARLSQPFLSPNEAEREGYVPNVLYTCGVLEHEGRLVLPYAMSDSTCSFASVSVSELIQSMERL